jgi:formylmethanofuran dehydrogenase subunit E
MHKDHSHDRETRKIKSYDEAVEFHGHDCLGLTLGYRAAEIAIRELAAGRSADEEIVAVVENDACGIDAIQVVTGCTIGKGNLIFRDYGKHVYTFMNRQTGDAVRLSLNRSFGVSEMDPAVGPLRTKVQSGTATAGEEADFHRRMGVIARRIMRLPDKRLYEIKHVKADIPEKARIFESVKCGRCGEMVAESRARVRDGKFSCIPCFDEYTRGW